MHGRFQPFHNGHLDYVLQAFERSDFISVGLTQIFKPRLSEEDTGRNTAAANPLSFLERSQLVGSALLEAGIANDRYDIVPFPIETPRRLREFVSLDTVCFTTELNPWNSEKIRLLTREGFAVERLKVSEIDNVRVASGTTIRGLIRRGDDIWKNFVPLSVFGLISTKYLAAFEIPPPTD